LYLLYGIGIKLASIPAPVGAVIREDHYSVIVQVGIAKLSELHRNESDIVLNVEHRPDGTVRFGADGRIRDDNDFRPLEPHRMIGAEIDSALCEAAVRRIQREVIPPRKIPQLGV